MLMSTTQRRGLVAGEKKMVRRRGQRGRRAGRRGAMRSRDFATAVAVAVVALFCGAAPTARCQEDQGEGGGAPTTMKTPTTASSAGTMAPSTLDEIKYDGPYVGSDVVSIGSYDAYDATVLADPGVWAVHFYDGDSSGGGGNNNNNKVIEAYKKLASVTKGIYNVAAVDVSAAAKHDDVAGVGQILSMYETAVGGDLADKVVVVVGGRDNQKVIPTKATSSADDANEILRPVVESLYKASGTTLQERAKKHGLDKSLFDFGAKQNGKRQQQQQQQQQRQQRETSGNGDGKKKRVKPVTLTTANFQKRVHEDEEVSLAIVAFTAPWCGHCQRLQPEWNAVASAMQQEKSVLVGWVDATAETQLATTFSIRGYPTIKVFSVKSGGGSKKSVTDYNGDRSSAAIVGYLYDMLEKIGVPMSIPEINNSTTVREHCAGQNHLCVVAVLPHILDSGAEGRNKYINVLGDVSKSFRGTSSGTGGGGGGSAFSFLWVEGGSQPHLEQTMELTFGYPALVALSLHRNAFAVMHGSYSTKTISGFLYGIANGRQKTVPFRGKDGNPTTGEDLITKIVKTEQWDGKDAPPIEEEFDLSELFDEGEL